MYSFFKSLFEPFIYKQTKSTLFQFKSQSFICLAVLTYFHLQTECIPKWSKVTPQNVDGACVRQSTINYQWINLQRNETNIKESLQSRFEQDIAKVPLCYKR